LERIPSASPQVKRTSLITNPTTFTTYFAESAESVLSGGEKVPNVGGKFYAVRVNCLDGVDIDELVNAPITYYDGAHDKYDSPRAEIRHL
jgi:hypothetical protein